MDNLSITYTHIYNLWGYIYISQKYTLKNDKSTKDFELLLEKFKKNNSGCGQVE